MGNTRRTKCLAAAAAQPPASAAPLKRCGRRAGGEGGRGAVWEGACCVCAYIQHARRDRKYMQGRPAPQGQRRAMKSKRRLGGGVSGVVGGVVCVKGGPQGRPLGQNCPPPPGEGGRERKREKERGCKKGEKKGERGEEQKPGRGAKPDGERTKNGEGGSHTRVWDDVCAHVRGRRQRRRARARERGW